MNVTAIVTAPIKSVTSISFIIVEDDSSLRPLLQRKLTREPGFVCLGSFVDAESALHWLQLAEPPDVALVDWKLPGMNGGEFIQRLKELYPHVRVVVITSHHDFEILLAAFAAGAESCWHKPVPLPEMPGLVRALYAGEAPLFIRMGRHLLGVLQSLAPAQQLAAQLSGQERTVLELLAQGCQDKLIAERLDISIHTVIAHKRKLYKKLGVHSARQAVVHWHSTPR